MDRSTDEAWATAARVLKSPQPPGGDPAALSRNDSFRSSAAGHESPTAASLVGSQHASFKASSPPAAAKRWGTESPARASSGSPARSGGGAARRVDPTSPWRSDGIPACLAGSPPRDGSPAAESLLTPPSGVPSDAGSAPPPVALIPADDTVAASGRRPFAEIVTVDSESGDDDDGGEHNPARRGTTAARPTAAAAIPATASAPTLDALASSHGPLTRATTGCGNAVAGGGSAPPSPKRAVRDALPVTVTVGGVAAPGSAPGITLVAKSNADRGMAVAAATGGTADGGGEEPTAAYTNILIAGITRDVDDAGLRAMCEAFGPVVSAVVMVDQHTGHSRGFGFALFEDAADAAAARAGLHGRQIGAHNRLRVEPSSQHRHQGQRPAGDTVFVRNIPLEISRIEALAYFRAVVAPYVAEKLSPDEAQHLKVRLVTFGVEKSPLQVTQGRLQNARVQYAGRTDVAAYAVRALSGLRSFDIPAAVDATPIDGMPGPRTFPARTVGPLQLPLFARVAANGAADGRASLSSPGSSAPASATASARGSFVGAPASPPAAPIAPTTAGWPLRNPPATGAGSGGAGGGGVLAARGGMTGCFPVGAGLPPQLPMPTLPLGGPGLPPMPPLGPGVGGLTGPAALALLQQQQQLLALQIAHQHQLLLRQQHHQNSGVPPHSSAERFAQPSHVYSHGHASLPKGGEKDAAPLPPARALPMPGSPAAAAAAFEAMRRQLAGGAMPFAPPPPAPLAPSQQHFSQHPSHFGHRFGGAPPKAASFSPPGPVGALRGGALHTGAAVGFGVPGPRPAIPPRGMPFVAPAGMSVERH